MILESLRMTAFHALTLNTPDNFFQKMILFSNIIVLYNCNIFCVKPVQYNEWLIWLSQHCWYWWPGALAPGHQYPHCWMCTHAFLAVNGLRAMKVKVTFLLSEWLRITWLLGMELLYPTVNVKYHCPCMKVMHPKALATWLFVQQLVRAIDKENLKALYYWPFVCEGNLPETDGFPSQRASHVESACLSWHHKYLIWLISPQTEMMVISHIKMKRLSVWQP